MKFYELKQSLYNLGGARFMCFLVPNMVNKLCAYIRIAMKFTPFYDQCF